MKRSIYTFGYLFILIIIYLSCTQYAKAGDSTATGRRRYIGFNTMPILSQILPFNNISPFGSTFSILMRNYGKNNIGIRTGFGIVAELNETVLAFQIGYDRRRKLSKNFLYNTGSEFVVELLSTGAQDPVGFFGISLHWGIEYKLNNIVSFSTESSLRIGGNGEGPIIKLRPPLNIFAHFNISNL